MCVIAFCKQNRLKDEVIEKCFKSNPDGAGIAWIDGDFVTWQKGLGLERIKEMAKTVRLPYVVHFRLKTVGNGLSLCHPFPVDEEVDTKLGGKAKKVLFHNGHWHSWRDVMLKTLLLTGKKLPKGAWSDSRAIAWLTHLCGDYFANLINQTVLIFSVENGITMLGDGWKYEDGIIYSNLNWKYGGLRITYNPFDFSKKGGEL